MVVSIREGRLGADDIINIIGGVNSNVVVTRVSEREGFGGTMGLAAQGGIPEERDMDVENLAAILGQLHPRITVERIYGNRNTPTSEVDLGENMLTDKGKKTSNSRSAFWIR